MTKQTDIYDLRKKYLVIPAYEPDHKLVDLIKEAYPSGLFDIIIVDDGSGEKYHEIFQQVQPFATVLVHPTNYGKGHSLKTAFQYILTHNPSDTGVVITADGDGQHSVKDIYAVGDVCESNPHSLILGMRSFSGKVPLKSRIGNLITRHVYRLESGCNISDTQTGLRAFSTEMLPFMLAVKGERYEYEMNVLLLWGREKKDILEIPIQTIYLEGNKSSHFRPLRDGILIYKDLLRFSGVSFLSFLIDYGIYLLLTALLPLWPELKIFLANTTARIISGIFNFEMNRHLVFCQKEKGLLSGLEYLCLAFCIYLLSTSGITLLYETFHCNLYLLKIGVDVSLFLVSWLVQKHVIFRKKQVTSNET